MNQFQKTPLLAVQSIFTESGCDQVPTGLEKLVEQCFEIPLINSVPSDLICNGTLVRFRGMVQDQFDPEFYLKVFSVTNRESKEKDLKCGMYLDVIDLQPGFEVDFESSENINGDRQTLYVVPIPGEAQWVIEGTKNNKSLCVHGCNSEQIPTDYRPKRVYKEDDNESSEEMDIDEDQGYQDISKKTKKGSGIGTSRTQSGRILRLNHPLPGETRFPCMVKVYNADSVNYPLNSLFEFIGIISSDPTLVNFESSSSDNNTELVDPFGPESALERQAHCPPPSLIPRLHCIKATPLHHCHPSLPLSLDPPISSQVFHQSSCDSKASRGNLLDLLTALFFGDHLAAEFVLLHLLSSVFGRTEVMSLGKLSLNLSQCPQFRDHTSFPSVVYQVLEQLVTKSHLLQLTLSNLNTTQFIPQKDYQANKLQTGLLQLSSGTHLVVDETVMRPGQLGPKGVANIAALGGVVQSQRIKYDFKYHQQEMDCDIPILILSDGKSLINVDCHIPLSSPSSSPSDPLSPPSPQSLLADYSKDAIAQMRQYLVLCKLLKYDIDNDIREKLQDDFVQRRRVDPQVTGDTFHYLLNLSRLITISHGEEKLSLQYWEHAKRMYMLQRQRLHN